MSASRQHWLGREVRGPVADAPLLFRPGRQRQIIQANAFAQGDQAIGKTDLDLSPAVCDLGQRSASGSSLQSERLALVQWQIQVMGFELHRSGLLP